MSKIDASSFDETLLDRFNTFSDRTVPILAVDHSGRGGNNFFVAIFDRHPEVLTCPLAYYMYSYFSDTFGQADEIDAYAAHEFATNTSYFRLIYKDLDAVDIDFYSKVGIDPDAPINRVSLRQVFDQIVLSSSTISRATLILACYFAYAIATGRDLGKIRYILLNDAISLKTESPFNGFSGRIIDSIVKDFKAVRLVHLVRDPRAAFASTNHQFINSNGNMYGLHWGNWWKSFFGLIRCDFGWRGGFIFGFVLLYLLQAFLAVERSKIKYADRFMVLRNEDLNLRFIPTMRALCEKLEISFQDYWAEADYMPTMLERPWRGMGAYNSTYQTNRYGPLNNDSDEVVKRSVAPNRYVTERWRNRLSKREIYIIEWCLRDELLLYGYPFLELSDHRAGLNKLLARLVFPLRGELPTPRWIARGRYLGAREVLDRLFYAVSFFPFYVGGRLALFSILRRHSAFSQRMTAARG